MTILKKLKSRDELEFKVLSSEAMRSGGIHSTNSKSC